MDNENVKYIYEYTKEDLEISIRQLKSVLFVRVEINDEGIITEIHVVSDTNKSVKQVVRDIESILAAKYNIKINHNVVSVALVNIDSSSNLILEKRLAYEEIITTIKRDFFECHVSLSYNGIIYSGEASGSIINRDRIISEATIDALHKFIGIEKIINLMDIKTINLADEEINVILLSFSINGNKHYRIGTSAIGNDPNISILKATLGAANRTLPLINNIK